MKNTQAQKLVDAQNHTEAESKAGFDNLLKRMLSTPPKPHAKPEKKKPGK